MRSFGCRRPPLVAPWLYRRILHPLLLRALPRRRRFLRATETYLPYFAIATTFDNTRAREALAPAIAPAPLRSYFSALADYAVGSRWGARPLTRAAASVAGGTRPVAEPPLVAA